MVHDLERNLRKPAGNRCRKPGTLGAPASEGLSAFKIGMGHDLSWERVSWSPGVLKLDPSQTTPEKETDKLTPHSEIKRCCRWASIL